MLQSLLPDVGTDIKGHMLDQSELLAASGYQDRPDEFSDLLRILDRKLRLITPTDPEDSPAQSDRDQAPQMYQLTHDYLVPSLRQWLETKQSWLVKLRKWSEDPNRIHEIGGMTVFVMIVFMVVHIYLFMLNSYPGEIEGIQQDAGFARAMLVWMAVFDLPMLGLGIALTMNRTKAVYGLLALDFVALVTYSVFFIDPSSYLQFFDIKVDSEAVVRGRYGAILLVVAGMLLCHAIAERAIRVNKLRGHRAA